jgi:hemoglobin
MNDLPDRRLPEPCAPELSFVASVSLRFEKPISVGETPDGVRFQFMLQGTVHGPALHGRFPLCTAHLLIDRAGIGTINVRAPLLLADGATAELEAIGRYDFGEDGYRRAVAKDLPNSALGWCPRLVTEDPRYAWLNRVLHVGVGELRPGETRVDYDLFSVRSLPTPGYPLSSLPESVGPEQASAPVTPGSLYDRLGGKPGVDAIARDFVDALVANIRLNRQNPKVAAEHGKVVGEHRRRGIQLASNMFCKLTGGPCQQFVVRSLQDSHVHLDITESDWDIMRGDLDRVLAKHRVRKAERDELFAIVEGTRSEIVKEEILKSSSQMRAEQLESWSLSVQK